MKSEEKLFSKQSDKYRNAKNTYSIAYHDKSFSALEKCLEMKKALGILIDSNEYRDKDPDAIKLYEAIKYYLSQHCICD